MTALGGDDEAVHLAAVYAGQHMDGVFHEAILRFKLKNGGSCRKTSTLYIIIRMTCSVKSESVFLQKRSSRPKTGASRKGHSTV